MKKLCFLALLLITITSYSQRYYNAICLLSNNDALISESKVPVIIEWNNDKDYTIDNIIAISANNVYLKRVSDFNFIPNKESSLYYKAVFENTKGASTTLYFYIISQNMMSFTIGYGKKLLTFLINKNQYEPIN